eukprot:gene3855-7687_t
MLCALVCFSSEISMLNTPRRIPIPAGSNSPIIDEIESLWSIPSTKVWISDNFDRSNVAHVKPEIPPSSIKVVSYNILGPIHGEGIKHAYATMNVRLWSKRREKLLDELRGMDADVLCLQEISAKALKDTFMPGLKHVGLECCAFAQGKEGQTRGKYTDKVVVESAKRVYLSEFCQLNMCKCRDFALDLQGRWNSMAMVSVRLKSTTAIPTTATTTGGGVVGGIGGGVVGVSSSSNQSIIIANTHLHWDPLRPDIKASQAHAVLEALTMFATEINGSRNKTLEKENEMKNNNKDKDINISSGVGDGNGNGVSSIPHIMSPLLPPVILCGDFNTKPEMDVHGGAQYNKQGGPVPSATFELYNTGKLTTEHP